MKGERRFRTVQIDISVICSHAVLRHEKHSIYYPICWWRTENAYDLGTTKVFQIRSFSPPDLCHAQLQTMFEVTQGFNQWLTVVSSRFQICEKSRLSRKGRKKQQQQFWATTQPSAYFSFPLWLSRHCFCEGHQCTSEYQAVSLLAYLSTEKLNRKVSAPLLPFISQKNTTRRWKALYWQEFASLPS